MRFAFIAAQKAEHTVTILCRCLCVTRSGFYAWHGRAESTHARDDRRLRVLVQASFDESKQRYGSPRIHEDLIEQQEHVSRKRVDPPDAGRRPEGAGAQALQADHHERSRPAGRGQSARPTVFGGGAESAVGQRYDRVRDRERWQRQALSRGGLRSVLTVHRRLGRQRRERPARHHQGAGDGPHTSVS